MMKDFRIGLIQKKKKYHFRLDQFESQGWEGKISN